MEDELPPTPNNAAFMSIIVESLLYASSPSFMLDERPELDYLAVLEELKDSNPTEFNSIDLKNICLFFDKDAAESAFVSNIKQLLNDKIEIVNLLENDEL